MKVEQLLAEIRSVTSKYVEIKCGFTTNATDYNGKRLMSDVKVKWTLYIADVTTTTGNAFPEFDTYGQLESFVNILLLELRRVHTDAVKNAVVNAIEILKSEFSKED